ncbi:MAG: hypothetical protein V4736_11975 [Bdellovibrionota bacterium]
MFLRSIILSVGLVTSANANVQSQPSFCDPDTFMSLERKGEMQGLKREHVYQVGDLTLVGLAVGDSDVTAVQTLALQHGSFQPDEKSCTWYMNDGNSSAAAAFNYQPMAFPLAPNPASDQFEAKIGPLMDQTATSFLSCARQHNYVAMGCDGMKHRGPSAFGMFLSFVGCSPENSTAIVNRIWGQNGVLISTRLEIAKRGYKLGTERIHSRLALQQIMDK